MNKTEFLANLATKYHKVGEPRPATKPDDFAVRQAEGFSFYVVGVYDLVGGIIKRGNVFFQVEDEGLAGETAHWEEKEAPEFLTRPLDDTLLNAINNYIKNNEPQGYVLHKITELDRDAKYAIADVWQESAGNVSKNQYFIAKPATSIVMYKIV